MIEIQPGKLYTAAETHGYYRVSRTTLWNWEKRRVLIPVRIGGKILKYKGEDILRLVNGGAA